ncbi:type IV secretory system conjugative DNA transfer family protein [Collinsella aerofaciens]|uniref:type IV secretory system conjugative DNA transfer family protein n=1 Tax=Collinsella aerofaciens TaxID=74426 RepID=UPI0032196590
MARRGYRVLLLDTQHPYRGQRFNPLRQVLDLHAEGRNQEAEQAADAIAELVVQDDEKGKGSHWTASARGLLSALVLLVSMSDECPEESKHLATVCEVLDRGTEAEGDDPAEPLKSVFRALPSGHPAKNRASQFVSSGGNELRSILSTLKVALRPFSSAPVAWMTSGSDIDPRSILENKSAVFLHVLDEGSPYNCIAAIFLSQLWASVQAAADSNGGRLPRPVQILGDEWGNLPRVECLPALLSLGRSFQIYWTGATQDISQLNKYGERDGRRKILANCGVKVAMKLAEEEDRRYFTELVGKTTRHTQGTSNGRAASGTSSSTSYSESADDVIHPWEWRDMAPDRDGVIVVKHADNGMPACRAGVFRSPVTDCTNTPTKEHFGLGTPEHEAGNRRAYQAGLDASATEKMAEAIPVWCPEWPEPEKRAGDAGGSKFSGLSLD